MLITPRTTPTAANNKAVERNDPARSPLISTHRNAKNNAINKNAGNVLDTISP